MSSKQKFGLIVVAFGFILLLERLFPAWFSILTDKLFWPLLLIAFGLYLFVSKR